MKEIGKEILSNTIKNALLRFVRKYKRWFKLQYLIHRKWMKKSYLQGMRGWSESEGISYQTPILRKRNCFWEGNTKIKKFEWKPKSVEDQSQKLARIISFKGF